MKLGLELVIWHAQDQVLVFEWRIDIKHPWKSENWPID